MKTLSLLLMLCSTIPAMGQSKLVVWRPPVVAYYRLKPTVICDGQAIGKGLGRRDVVEVSISAGHHACSVDTHGHGADLTVITFDVQDGDSVYFTLEHIPNNTLSSFWTLFRLVPASPEAFAVRR